MLPENHSWQWALAARLPSTITSILQHPYPERVKKQKLCVFKLQLTTADPERVKEQKLVSNVTLQEDRESKLSLCPGRQSMESRSHSPSAPDFFLQALKFSYFKMLQIPFASGHCCNGSPADQEELHSSHLPPSEAMKYHFKNPLKICLNLFGESCWVCCPQPIFFSFPPLLLCLHQLFVLLTIKPVGRRNRESGWTLMKATGRFGSFSWRTSANSSSVLSRSWSRPTKIGCPPCWQNLQFFFFGCHNSKA